jgi:hypothetical protein
MVIIVSTNFKESFKLVEDVQKIKTRIDFQIDQKKSFY